MKTEIRIRNLRRGEEKKHLEILNLCYDHWGNEEKWEKMYRQEEFDATTNVFVVEENGEWIGGVTAWFREAFLKEGRGMKVVIAGDGYVLPRHRGKGVYSLFMRSVKAFAQERGASLGLGFISVYEVPYVALPKYGFVDVFRPSSKVLVLNPEGFLDYLLFQIREVDFPRKFEGVKLRLIISFKTLKGKFVLDKMLQIQGQKMRELPATSNGGDSIQNRKSDLQISTDISTLLRLFWFFHSKKRTLLPFLFSAFMRRRFRIKVSMKFLRLLIG